jgi:hypothetical protein
MYNDFNPGRWVDWVFERGCGGCFGALMAVTFIGGIAAYLVREQTGFVVLVGVILVIAMVLKVKNKDRPKFKEWQGDDSVWEYRGRLYRGREDMWLDLTAGQLVTATNTAEKNWLNVALTRGHIELLRQRLSPAANVSEDQDYRSG